MLANVENHSKLLTGVDKGSLEDSSVVGVANENENAADGFNCSMIHQRYIYGGFFSFGCGTPNGSVVDQQIRFAPKSQISCRSKNDRSSLEIRVG